MAKWQSITTCAVIDAYVLIDNPLAWGRAELFKCGPDAKENQRRMGEAGATLWHEMPKRASAKGKAKSDDYTPAFERVWKGYPSPPNGSKWDAFRAFRSCTVEVQEKIEAVMPIVARDMLSREARYRPHLATWINGKRYETVQAPTAPTGPLGSAMSEIDWKGVLRTYALTSNWNVPAYGPPPGQPGCRVPANYL